VPNRPRAGSRGWFGTYHRAVAALERKLEDRDQWNRSEVDAMLLELADHDGDVDRLRAAERTEDAVAWVDRAVSRRRVTSHGGGNEYWLSVVHRADPPGLRQADEGAGREGTSNGRRRCHCP
jgi:hypothetical protein